MAGFMLNGFDIVSNGFQGGREGTQLINVEFAKEALDSEIPGSGLRNWNHWIKKLVWEHYMKNLQVLRLVCRPSVRVLVPHGFASIFRPTPLPSAKFCNCRSSIFGF